MFIHTKDKTMYKINPIVVGTKVFDKSMMFISMAMVRNLISLHEPEFASLDTIDQNLRS